MIYRIESYITSIILSYVDRYIKNFRREDVKLSLWEGDGVLYNLDLDLDALEHELNLPFSLISGHIHKLHIKVPWTRIASESVQITIDTIECIMKLKPPGPRPPMSSKKRLPAEESGAPPSYISSLVNKIVCNLSITCNNLILKYVEEDIVLSMNIKTLSLMTVNKEWLPEFSELTLTELILRKVVTLTDVTICLDKRNASGRIESYLEPLLYKCSLAVRLSRSYPNINAAHASSSRISVYCNNITFSISEPQVSMLLRLFLLMRMAMDQSRQCNGQSLHTYSTDNEAQEAECDNYNESWGSWLLGFVPSLYPLMSESTVSANQPPLHKFHFGLYIQSATIDLKLLKTDESRNWESILKMVYGGTLLEFTSSGTDWSNLQVGISSARLLPVPNSNQETYLECGEVTPSFLSESLFENPDMDLTQRPWDFHLNTVTETLMMERAPTFYMDYLSVVEREPCFDFDHHSRHVREKQLTRFVVGPVVMSVCSGLMDKLVVLKNSLYSYDYSPYTHTSITNMSPLSSDDINHYRDSVETEEGYFVAQNTSQFTLFGARLKILPSDKSTLHHPGASQSKSGPPYILVKVKCIDAKWTRPLYLDKMVALASQFNLPETTAAASNTTLSLMLVDTKVCVVVRDTEGPDMFHVLNLSLALTINNTFSRELHRGHFHRNTIILMEKMVVVVTKPKVILGMEIVNSLLSGSKKSDLLYNTSLVRDSRNTNESFYLELKVSDVELKYSLLACGECLSGKVGSAEGATLHTRDSAQSRDVVLDAVANSPTLQVMLQRPVGERWSVAPLIVVKVNKAWVNITPHLCLWLMYSPRNQHNRAFNIMETSGSGRKISSSSLSSVHKKQLVESRLAPSESDSQPSFLSAPFLDWGWIGSRGLSVVVSWDVANLRVSWISPTTQSHLVVVVPSVSVRSTLGRINYDSATLPLVVPNWSQERMNFPWSMFMCDVEGFTESVTKLPFLSRFSVTFTLALTTKTNPDLGRTSTVSLCLHIDTSPVHLSFSHPQVVLVNELVVCLYQVYSAVLPPEAASSAPRLPSPPPADRTRGPAATDESNSLTNSNSNKQGVAVSCETISGPKVTLWLQWTLAKLSVSLYTLPSRSSPENLKFLLDIDDIFMTLDVEPIYQKLKLKVATAQAKHFTRLSSRLPWKAGCYGGVLMRGNEPVDKESGDDFLSVTVTRASASNLLARLTHSSKKYISGEREYVVEVMTKVQPLDFVLSPTVVGKLLTIVEPLLDNEDLFPLGRSYSASPLSGQSVLNVTSASLPLLYFDVAFIRLFLPSSVQPSDVSQEDTVFVQVEKVSLSSEAVNPVARKFVRSELYGSTKSRFSSLPGSYLEDRQYQLDANISVTTGGWRELGAHLEEEDGQNPAVYWNSGLKGPPGGSTASPLLAPLSLSVIVAPPIITSGFIVSGLNVEVNVISEVELSANLEQLKLLSRLWTDTLAAFPNSSPERSFEAEGSPMQDSAADSGVESYDGSYHASKKDPEICMTGNKSRSISQLSLSTTTSINTKRYHQRSQTVPIDILVTTKAIVLKLSGAEGPLHNPLLYILVSQPYLALEKQADTSVYKGSVYEVEVRHGSEGHTVDKVVPESFPVTLVLNRNGDLDPYKGIPPALLNFKSISQGIRSPCVEVEIGRPVKVLCKTSSINYMNMLKSRLLECFQLPESTYRRKYPRRAASLQNKPQTIREAGEEGALEKVKEYLQTCSVLNVTTKQIVVDFNMADQGKSGCMVSLGGWKGVTEWCQGSLNLSLELYNACVSTTEAWDGRSLVLGPWSLAGCLNWEPRTTSVSVRLDAGILPVHISKRVVQTISAVVEEFKPYLLSDKDTSTTIQPSKSGTEWEDEEQHYQDDLQAGAFQFITAESSSLLAYQVVFPSATQMAWTYPAPRAISRLVLLPLPLLEPGEVGLSVDYLDCGVWRTWVQFSSDMTTSVEPLLPRVPRVASTWRVSLDSDRASATAMAAALRVNSIYSPRLVPAFTLSLDVQSLQVSVWCGQSVVVSLPGQLSRYTPDNRLPPSFPAGTLFLEQMRLSLTRWYSGETEVETELRPRVDVLNPRLVHQQCCVQPFGLRVWATNCRPGPLESTDPRPAPDWSVSLMSSRVVACFAPPAAHTLLSCTRGALLTPYIVCNDLYAPLRFGQSGTNEDICLQTLQCCFYSWRSTTQKLDLRFSINTSDSGHGWSEPVSLEKEEAVRLCVEDICGRVVVLVINIRHLSPILTQVEVGGRLVVYNTLDRPIECRLVADNISDRQQRVTLSAGARAPCLPLSSHSKYSLRLSLADHLWSGLVPVMTNNNVWLVKIPLKDKDEYLSVWCQIIQESDPLPRLFVIVSPIYLVRSWLPCEASLQIRTEGFAPVGQSLAGRGALTSLRTPGTATHTHTLNFYIQGVETEGGSGIPLSYSLVEGKSPAPPPLPTVGQLIDMADRCQLLASPWTPILQGLGLSPEILSVATQPNTVTHVKVKFGGDVLKYTNSVVVELRPWALLVNTSGLYIYVYQDQVPLVGLPHLSVVAPPPLQSSFQLAAEVASACHQSSPIELSQNQVFFMPHISGIVPLNGSLPITIPADKKVGCLVVQSKMCCGVRLLHVTSQLSVVNVSSMDLSLAALQVATTDRKQLHPQNLDPYSVPLPCQTQKPMGLPVSVWHLVGEGKERKSCLLLESAGGVSTPVYISSERQTQTVLLPTEGDSANLALTVVTHTKDGVTYVTVDDQPSPQLVVHNRSGVQLVLARSSQSIGCGVALEDFANWDWRLVVPNRKSAFYFLGGLEALSKPPQPVVIARTETSGWSSCISLVGNSSGRLVSVPNCHDLTAVVSRRGPTIHLTLTPANQKVVAASDIRSRLTAIHQLRRERVSSVESATSFSSVDLPVLPEDEHPNDSVRVSGGMVKGFIKGVTLILCSESTQDHSWSEMASLSLDSIAVVTKLKEENSESTERNIEIRVSELEIDNEEYQKGGYDFGVVLVSQPKQRVEFSLEDVELAVGQAMASPSVLDLTIVVDQLASPMLQELKVRMAPMEAYVEDVYLQVVKEELSKLVPELVVVGTGEGGRQRRVEPLASENEPCMMDDPPPNEEDDLFNVSDSDNESVEVPEAAHSSYLLGSTLFMEAEDVEEGDRSGEEGRLLGVPFPEDMLLAALELCRPLVLRNLSVSELSLLVSVHTSTKFYIALDNSPLSFAPFVRSNLVSTTYRLGHALTLHYFLGAIYGTGWALGSLQLLGAPAGLARSVGEGIKSFVTLPCVGALHQGPTGFFLGIVHGSAALMKHVTAGTLTSLSKFAGSWSRTLDRLTLDEEDLRYAEEMRRLRPQGLGQSLKQGLTEFGVSLLGGVGGLARQPLEYVCQGNKSLAGALGSALVGAVTRPLSGAAGLLALAGHGILSGAGWTDNHLPKYECIRGKYKSQSLLKLMWKVCRGEQVLAVVEATMEDLSTCSLMVTEKSLAVIDSDDLVVHSFSLQAVTVLPDLLDPTLVNLTLTPTDHGVESYSKKRVEEYIRESRRALGSWPSPPASPPSPLHFYLSPPARSFLLAVVDLATRHANNYGFNLLS